MKILVADDSQTNLALLTQALKQLGHETIAKNSSEQAIDSFVHEKPDLVILDVVMQGMDGFECAKKIRAIESDDWIPIIFLSASVDDASIAKGIDAGGDDYLTKPFSHITLAAKIKAMQRISDMRKKLYDATCQLSLLSSTDTLTGVYNRLQFNKILAEKLAYAKRHKILLALLFIDLDNFKFVNDQFGHQEGDLLLSEVAKRLQSCIREYDFVARLGGDEFAIIINDITTEESVGSIAQTILDVLGKPYLTGAHRFDMGCSIGIACFPMSGKDQETLVRNADSAMYQAKEAGRNNYQYFSRELLAKQSEEDYLRKALKQALEHNEFFLLYEPVLELETRHCVGMEALLRWQHPKQGILLPQQFLPLAEDMGIISLVNQCLLQKGCQQAGLWYAQGYQQFNILINIPCQQLLQKDFVPLVQQILTETQLPPSYLQLELKGRERVSRSYSKNLRDVVNTLSEMGVGIVLNDFGVASASMLDLKQLSIHALKIAESFLSEVPNNVSDAMIVKSIIALCNNFSLAVIADGIRTEEQYQFLVANHCEKGQGPYFSEPMSDELMANYLQSRITEKQP